MNSSVNPYPLWDIAGVDGLEVMKALFGAQVDRIAPFQSLEAELDGWPCSILRLCEGNFRLSWQGDPSIKAKLANAVVNRRVWMQQFDWIGSLVLPASVNPIQLADIAIAKPPFQLRSLALHCALPARIDGISVLVWRHLVHGQDQLELHTAVADVQRIELILQQQSFAKTA